MINLVLSIISSICIFVILVQMIKLNIPLGLHNYYKKYSYNAMIIDFIRITIVLLLVVIIFKLIESTIFVVFIIILLSVLFGVDMLLVQFLEYCKDSLKDKSVVGYVTEL